MNKLDTILAAGLFVLAATILIPIAIMLWRQL